MNSDSARPSLRRRAVRVIRRVLRSSGTPHSIALGVAIGFVVAWTPTMGFQMIIAAPICLLLRANFLAAVPPIWLTNPATMVPIYGFNYWVGLRLVGGPGLHEFRSRFGEIAHLFRESDSTWREILSQCLDLTGEFLWPLWIGSFVVGLALAIPSYALTFKAVEVFRARRQKRREQRKNRAAKAARRADAPPASPLPAADEPPDAGSSQPCNCASPVPEETPRNPAHCDEPTGAVSGSATDRDGPRLRDGGS